MLFNHWRLTVVLCTVGLRCWLSHLSTITNWRSAITRDLRLIHIGYGALRCSAVHALRSHATPHGAARNTPHASQHFRCEWSFSAAVGRKCNDNLGVQVKPFIRWCPDNQREWAVLGDMRRSTAKCREHAALRCGCSAPVYNCTCTRQQWTLHRFWWNLVRRCVLNLTTWRETKNLNLNFKIQEGR